MIIGVPRETKADEYRVALLPVGAELLSKDGHTVLLERNAGLGAGFDDDAYAAAGARLLDTPDELFAQADTALDAGHAAAVNMREGKIANSAVAAGFPDLPHV